MLITHIKLFLHKVITLLYRFVSLLCANQNTGSAAHRNAGSFPFCSLTFITLVDLEATVLLVTKAGCVFQILPVQKVKRL